MILIFLMQPCNYFLEARTPGMFSYFYWVNVHFGSYDNCILLNSGTLARKIKCEPVQCYYDSHTSFPIKISSMTILSLQRLPKHYKRNMIKSMFFSTEGKASRRKLKHKRNKAFSIIILSNMFFSTKHHICFQ